MDNSEKLVKILSLGWEIRIFARAYPLAGSEQGFLPKRRVCTSEKEGEVFSEPPFCICYHATKGDRNFSDTRVPVDKFIDLLYDHCMKDG